MKKHLYLFCCIAFITGVPFSCLSQIIYTFAGNGLAGFSGDHGDAASARLNMPTSLAKDGYGNVYISDQFNNRVRKVDAAGIITTFAGTGTDSFGGDGGPATASGCFLGHSWGLATDNAGNVYIADQDNHRIRMVNTAGEISTVAGTGSIVESGIGGPAIAAGFGSPIGITTSNSGNIYFTDASYLRVNKIDAAGVITRVAGNGSTAPYYCGDNSPALNACFSHPFGMAMDNNGNLYISDAENNRIRKVNPSGIVSTIAGNGSAVFSGDGGPAVNAGLNNPTGVCVSDNGTIYIADFGNNRIRKITGGIISTVAGTGIAGYNGDGISAITAQLSHPTNVMLDTLGDLYITDLDNQRVRKISNILTFTAGDSRTFHVCANSTPQSINTLLTVRDLSTGQTDHWTLLQAPVHGIANASYSMASPGGMLTPTGLTYTPYSGYIGQDLFKVKVSNALGSDTILLKVIIDSALTAGTVTGPSMLCVGATITLSNSLAGGEWSSGPLTSVTGLATGCTVKGLAAGIDTVNYIVSNGCGAVFTSAVLTINPLPETGTITGPGALCKGTSITLFASVSAGTWSSSNTSRAIVNPATGIVSGLIPGTVTITYLVANQWCTATVLHNITVEVLPDPGTIIGPLHLCEGTQMVLTNAVTGGVWSSSNGCLAVAGGTVNGVSVGSGDISYAVTNSCGTMVNIKTITVNPMPEAPSITEHQGLLSVPAIYSSYQWFANGDLLPGATADTCSASVSGIYNVTVTNNFGCASLSQSLEHIECTANDLLIYPNPTAGLLNVQWCKRVVLRVFCDDGKEVGRQEQVNKIDLSGLPNAVYLLSVFDAKGNKLTTRRITKATK